MKFALLTISFSLKPRFMEAHVSRIIVKFLIVATVPDGISLAEPLT